MRRTVPSTKSDLQTLRMRWGHPISTYMRSSSSISHPFPPLNHLLPDSLNNVALRMSRHWKSIAYYVYLHMGLCKKLFFFSQEFPVPREHLAAIGRKKVALANRIGFTLISLRTLMIYCSDIQARDGFQFIGKKAQFLLNTLYQSYDTDRIKPIPISHLDLIHLYEDTMGRTTLG